jgi:hypothetical protein
MVRIEAADGRQLERRVAVARGGLASPWPPGEVEAKFRALAGPIIGDAAASELQDRILGLGGGEDMGRVFDLLAGRVGGA